MDNHAYQTRATIKERYPIPAQFYDFIHHHKLSQNGTAENGGGMMVVVVSPAKIGPCNIGKVRL
jgi:hypothetical protein